jgi:hypothetical protein
VLQQFDCIAAFATSATIPNPLFGIDGEAIMASASGTSTNKFARTGAFQFGVVLRDGKNIGLARPLDQGAVEPAHSTTLTKIAVVARGGKIADCAGANALEYL